VGKTTTESDVTAIAGDVFRLEVGDINLSVITKEPTMLRMVIASRNVAAFGGLVLHEFLLDDLVAGIQEARKAIKAFRKQTDALEDLQT